MYGYIYKTTNLRDNKIYIGQHKGNSFDPNYYGSGSWFTKVLNKYGKNNFKCEIIEECDDIITLNNREIYWIEFYQSRNPEIGYNLAKGGDQIQVGCTEQEIITISNILLSIDNDNLYEKIILLQKYGLRVYEQNDEWVPTSTNSNGAKMRAKDNSIVVSFYTKKQMSITREYAELLNCQYWKYNMLIEIDKLPIFMNLLIQDYKKGRIIPETFQGPGRGTSGIFFETHKHTKSARMALKLDSFDT